MKIVILAAAALSFRRARAGARDKSIKMQSTWPASNTLQEHFKLFGERLEKLTQGSIKIEAMPAGQIVPPSRCSTRPTRRCSTAGTRSPTTGSARTRRPALFAAPPGGPFGMDHMDYLGWLYVGGGLQMWRDFYQNDLKLNVIVWPRTLRARRRSAGSRSRCAAWRTSRASSAARPASTPRSTRRWA
jgi:TRAP-type mannitol/chloroaromatic compound transport system substrate-binding protein